MLMPGFVDSHVHVSISVSWVYEVGSTGCRSLEAYLAAVAEFAAANPDLPRIQGEGWASRAPGIGPLAQDLDVIVSTGRSRSRPGRPLAVGEHQGARAGRYHRQTPDPEGGVIERVPGHRGAPGNPYGVPSGTLRETATTSSGDLLPDYTVDQYVDGLLFSRTTSRGRWVSRRSSTRWSRSGSNAAAGLRAARASGGATMRVRAALTLDPADVPSG